MLFLILLKSLLVGSALTSSVTFPLAPTSSHTVLSNFLGVSIELSFLNNYFGNDTSTIPSPVIAYLSQLKSRTGSNPVRLRVGGNSADSSSTQYVPTQTEMLILTDPNANSNNQPVDYGPTIWKVMKVVADSVGGVEYLIGLSLNDTAGQDALIAAAAKDILGDSLDALIVGNEPDLYTDHGTRPGLANYTVQDYFGEYSAVQAHLTNTTAGNMVSGPTTAGPTICCNWDLDTLLQQGYLATFGSILKYITLQRYPQNNCMINSKPHAYNVPYYMQHANVVTLASWQKPGIDSVLASQTTSTSPQVVMCEFNSASCGGVPGISDTFAVGSLWSIDYAMQLASVGYSAAYIHTREAGISYNLFAPPVTDTLNGPWTTNPPFYALIATAEILESNQGVKVVDLDLESSKTDMTATTAGYAVFDATNSSIIRLALFNYDNASTQFILPPSPIAGQTTVKFLTASSATENQKIAWSDKTFLGAGDGKFVAVPRDSDQWAIPNLNLDCSSGCTIDVPLGPALAVVFLGEVPKDLDPATSTNQSSTRRNYRSTRFYISIIICLLASVL